MFGGDAGREVAGPGVPGGTLRDDRGVGGARSVEIVDDAGGRVRVDRLERPMKDERRARPSRIAMSISSTVESRHATSATASSRSAPWRRLRTNRSTSRGRTIGVWPIPAMSARVVSTVFGSATGEGTISTAGMRWGGLRGWATRQRGAASRPSVKVEGSRAEVELASTASGSARAASSAKTARLTSSFSGVFS